MRINENHHVMIYEHSIKFVTNKDDKWVVTLKTGEEIEVDLDTIFYEDDTVNFNFGSAVKTMNSIKKVKSFK